VDKYARTVGKLTVERDWAVGKLGSLDLSTKRAMVELQAANNTQALPSPSKQHAMLGISRSYRYCIPVLNPDKEAIKQRIMAIAEDEFMCVYGEEKVYRYNIPTKKNQSQTRKSVNLYKMLEKSYE